LRSTIIPFTETCRVTFADLTALVTVSGQLSFRAAASRRGIPDSA